MAHQPLPADLLYSCKHNKYVRPRNTRTEIHAGRVACRLLVSHVEYAPRALITLEKNGTDGRTDARPFITLTIRHGQRNNSLLTDAWSVL